FVEGGGGIRDWSVTGVQTCALPIFWRLTGGRHLTDATNASRTLLLDIRKAAWDDDLCRYFGVPRALLSEVQPSAADFGTTRGLRSEERRVGKEGGGGG